MEAYTGARGEYLICLEAIFENPFTRVQSSSYLFQVPILYSPTFLSYFTNLRNLGLPQYSH